MKKILFYSIAFTTLISCAANKYHYFDYQSVPLANESEINKCEQVFDTLLNTWEVAWFESIYDFDSGIRDYYKNWEKDVGYDETYYLFSFATDTFQNDVLKLLDYDEYRKQQSGWRRLTYSQYLILNTFNITTLDYEKLQDKLIFTQNIPTIDEEVKTEHGVKKQVYWVLEGKPYLIDNPVSTEIFSNFDIDSRDLITKDGFDYEINFDTFYQLTKTFYFEIMVYNHFLSIKDESALKLCTIMNDRSAFDSSIYSDYLEDSVEE